MHHRSYLKNGVCLVIYCDTLQFCNFILIGTESSFYLCITIGEVPQEYWEVIAERRHDALNDSLKENEEVEIMRFKFNIITNRIM